MTPEPESTMVTIILSILGAIAAGVAMLAIYLWYVTADLGDTL
jgi:hypothetical protein